MKFISKILDRFVIARELLSFFWKKKLWWMIPLILMILLLAVFLVFAQGASVAPFIYTLF